MKQMSTVRREYKLNSGDIRAIARYAKNRDEKLREACRERAYWLGDRWSQPISSEGAKAALLVLRDRSRCDPLAAMAETSAKIQPDQRLIFLRIKTGLRHLWTMKKGRLP